MDHSKYYYELNLFDEMFLNEHNKAIENLKKYSKLMKQYLNFVKQQNDDHATFIKKHAMVISNFSSISNAIRLFNIEMETVKMLDVGPLEEIETEIKSEPTLIDSNLRQSLPVNEPLPVTNPIPNDEQDFEEHYTYPKIDFSNYFINYESKGTISFVKNAAKKLFYMIDLNSEYYCSGVLNMEEYFTEHRIKLEHFPKEGTVFGLYIDNYIFRAVRQNREPQNEQMKLFMIDVGEEVIYEPENHSIYLLPEMYQKIPSQALLCKLANVQDCLGTNYETFLKNNKYSQMRFKILNIKKEIFHVEMCSLNSQPSTNPFANVGNSTDSVSSSETEISKLPLTNPFRQFRCKKSNISLTSKAWSDSKFITENYCSNKQENINQFADLKLTNINHCPEPPKDNWQTLQQKPGINVNDQFADLKLTNINQCPSNDNWQTLQQKPGINVNAPLYVPKNQFNNKPADYFPTHETNNQIVPYYQNNNNFCPTNNYHQQPLLSFNHNKFTNNQMMPNQLNFKSQNINYTPIMPINKKMLNTETNELLQPEQTPTHQNYNNAYNQSSFKHNMELNECMAPTAQTSMTPFIYNNNCTNNSSYKNNEQNFEIQNNLLVQENVPHKYYELNAEQIRILNEEPLSTDNAMVAVMGYDPKDDKRICKFYNSQTGACFKGDHCKYEHVQINKDGWTRDQVATKISTLADMIYPDVGKSYEMILTHIVSVEEFFAHIPSLNPRSLQTLEELNVKMNSMPMKSAYIPFNIPPVEQELVLGLYTDKQWYRARVLNVLDDDTFQIFFIDYGNCRTVPLTELRKWNEYFDFLPPQAFHCRLENVTLIKPFDFEAITFFKEITSKPVLGRIINNLDRLYVTLLDTEGFDIGEQICVSSHGHPRSIIETLPEKKNHFIPV